MSAFIAKGPWAVVAGRRTSKLRVANEDGLVATVECATADTLRGAHTARLIAAAPLLLEALNRIVSYYDLRRHNGRLPSLDSQAECEHEDTMFGEARAAIASAAGGPRA